MAAEWSGGPRRRVAVIGAGWAGLAAAVEAIRRGHSTTVFEMAQEPGGRARTLGHGAQHLDNGQHILIGAYRESLALMAALGVDLHGCLLRQPLSLRFADGPGLRLPSGPAVPAFLRGVLGWRALPWRDRLSLLAMAARWRLGGFTCPSDWSVARLCAGAPVAVMRELIEPLCVAALNTPADRASAQVLLTVLRDAIFGAPGGSDLILPRVPLSDLLPAHASRWLRNHGVDWRANHRAQAIVPAASGRWQVDGETFDAVIVATPAGEASRLLAGVAPDWSAQALALRHEPIITVWLQARSEPWPEPMLALRADQAAPAQFAFSLEPLGGPAGVFAFVISGASAWVEAGLDATAEAVRRQAAAILAADPGWQLAATSVLSVRAEKRATFVCSPGLIRPSGRVLPGLGAAGDYIQGPYPATLEGAVRSGLAAAHEV